MDAGTATIVSAVIAAVAAIISAYLSSKSRAATSAVEKKIKIRQSRMDERDIILKESGFLIPVENDDMWRDYYDARTTKDLSRQEASKEIEHKMPSSTDERVRDRLYEWQHILRI